MHSRCGRYVIAFNGEIYNHLSLRKELEKASSRSGWEGHSDTETLVEGFSFWGIQETLQKILGMFAISIWDTELQTLSLVRDRMGEKPLYYGRAGEQFVFASELKAIKIHPSFQKRVNRNALCAYFRHNYIPAPFSIWEGIYKLMPGQVLTFSTLTNELEISDYWSVREVAARGIATPFDGTPEEAVNALEQQLQNAVASQMISDVPLGAFLSGGIDSSTVVALMQAGSSRKIETFSIGFNEDEFNEAQHAKAVARHLGTSHTEWYIQPGDAFALIPELASLYDEPFADSSQIPTCLLAQMTRQHVTVSLSGDGGDELFCGYNRYEWAPSLWRKLSLFPLPLRSLLFRLVTALPPAKWNGILNGLKRLLPEKYRYDNLGDKVHKLAALFAVKSPEEIYRHLVSHWSDPASIVIGGVEPESLLQDESRWLASDSLEQRMMYLDQQTYLPDDILVKVDRAAMGVSLETRVPMLDRNIVEFAWSLPIEYKLRSGITKWPLRNVLYRYVPAELIERPKTGFGIPIADWLRGPLRGWVEELIQPDRLESEGYLQPAPISEKWLEHLSGRRNWGYYIWDVVMFQSWLEHEGIN